MSDPFIGEIRMAGYNFAPRGFALCNGQLLSIAQNQALFSILGTTYGGDGITTFGLPNLQGRVPMSAGTGGGGSVVLGQTSGEVNHTLLTNEMPSHNHALNAAAAPVGSGRSPESSLYAPAKLSGADYNLFAAGNPIGVMNPGVVGPAGGSQAHNNMQPYLAVTFYIALSGIYPSRN